MVSLPDPPAGEHVLTLDPRRTTLLLTAIAAVLVAAGTAGQILAYRTGHDSAYGLIAFFDLRREANPPAFFSALLLLGASLLLALRASLARVRREEYVWSWRILAAGFALMALDEAASLHEILNRPTRAVLGPFATGWFRYAWVLPAMLIVVPVLASFAGFVRALARPTGGRFVTAAAVYLGGAILMEMVGAKYASEHGESAFGYSMLITIEESMEMGGVIMFIHALLDHLRVEGHRVLVRFAPASVDAVVPRPQGRLRLLLARRSRVRPPAA